MLSLGNKVNTACWRPGDGRTASSIVVPYGDSPASRVPGGGVVSAALAVSAFLRACSCSWCSFSAISAPVRALASALPFVSQCTHPLGLTYLAVPARFHFRPASACPRPGGAVDTGICQARSRSREEGVLVLLGKIRPRYVEL
jgi:hypothetical protein